MTHEEKRLLITLALVVYRMAPPDDQKDVERAMNDMESADIALDQIKAEET